MIKYRTTYNNTDGSISIYEHSELFYLKYCAQNGDDGHFEKIESNEPIVEFRKIQPNKEIVYVKNRK